MNGHVRFRYLKSLLYSVQKIINRALGVTKMYRTFFCHRFKVCAPKTFPYLSIWRTSFKFSHFLESIHDNLVRKIRPHFGVQVLHPTNLIKFSERVTHNKRFHYVSLLLCVTRSEDFLKFVRCNLQNLKTNKYVFIRILRCFLIF